MEYFVFILILTFGFAAVANYSYFNRIRNTFYFKIKYLNEELSGVRDKSKYVLTRRFDSNKTYNEVGQQEINEENLTNSFYKALVVGFQREKRVFKVLNYFFVAVVIISSTFLLIKYPTFVKDIFEND